MEIVERLTLEAAQADTMLASEHRQRYDFVAPLLSDLRVLDLCCGSGYGTAILAARAREVVGVDRDVATIETAQATIGGVSESTSFVAEDAARYLGRGLLERFDAVVCFEGLEHLPDVERVLTLLREFAEQGGRVIASVPNGKMFREQNPFHLTEFGYPEAMAAFAPFPAPVTMLPQFLAEGSLICPPGAQGTEVSVVLGDRNEPAYANHFIFFVNVAPAELERVHHGHLQATGSPIFNRWSEGLKHAIGALRRENARLARGRLGKADSAAASALARLQDREAQVIALQERLRFCEARLAELRSEPTASRVASEPARVPGEPSALGDTGA